MKTDVTRVMKDEHQLILRMIALVEQNVTQLERERFSHWEFFLDAVDFIRNYADRFHHAKEEEVLFHALVDNGMPAKQSPIEAMLIEHEQGRAHVRAMEMATRQVLAGDIRKAAVIAVHAKGYAQLLRSHIDKEDHILYPLAERVLPQDVRAGMLAAYRQAEASMPDLDEKYREMVARYERQFAA